MTRHPIAEIGSATLCSICDIYHRNSVECPCCEARRVAQEYYFDLSQLLIDYQWEKHYAGDVRDYPWLEPVKVATGPDPT